MALHLLLILGLAPATSAWLELVLTYALHSAVWSVAAVACVRSRVHSPSTRSRIWKMALFGPLATTLLMAALTTHDQREPLARAPLRTVSVVAVAESPPAHNRGSTWLGVSALAVALAGPLRFGLAAFALRRRLRARVLVRDSRLLGRLQRMVTRAGLSQVRLSESVAIGSPLVIGTREICIPHARLACLGNDEIDAVFAHELAHLERGDGVWFPLVTLVQSTLWLQPLNHLAAARFRESAELACDDRAVALTGDPIGLARALVHVAESVHLPAALTPTMARGPSAIVPRVTRLTRGGASFAKSARPWPARLAVVLFATMGATAATVRVRVASARAISSPTASCPERALAEQRSAALAEQERTVERQLERALLPSAAFSADIESSERVLELRQALSHARAARRWNETQVIECRP